MSSTRTTVRGIRPPAAHLAGGADASSRKLPFARTPQVGRRGSEDSVYDAILRAYVMGRLSPGLRLPEGPLADIFGVSRERVRRVLQRLAHERWLEIVPNRGAVVPRPTREDAQEVTQARTIIETGVIKQLLDTPRLIDRQALRRHLVAEQQALRRGDAVRMTRLTAEFHGLLASFLRNQWIRRQVEELTLRGLVYVSLYGDAAGPTCCGPREHRQIAQWLLAGDAERAKSAMVEHLEGLLLFLDFRTDRALSTPAADIFRAELKL
ncbi:MAG: GntR family transcriptional regulator [Hyphomicrobiaceae bacterium]